MNCLKKLAYSVVAIAMITGFSVSAQAKEWKGWNIHVAGYPNTVAMDKFAELLSEKSGLIKKHTSLTPQFKKKYLAGFFKKHTPPHLVLRIFLSHTL